MQSISNPHQPEQSQWDSVNICILEVFHGHIFIFFQFLHCDLGDSHTEETLSR